MCGICGIVSLDGVTVRPEDLLAMRDQMVHRGPDDSGMFTGEGVALGHRRLSIIDLSSGQQPMANEDGSVVIVYNGELYNYLDLRNILLGRGHIFSTHSDTEVIVHAYEEFGPTCLEYFRGMFAFAIWDCRRRRLFAARDRIGEKPFYYAQWDGLFLFASEIKAILAHPAARREVNYEALNLYFGFRYVPGPRTMFAGIEKLQPGHSLVLEQGELKLNRYWDICDIRTSEILPEDAQEEFVRRLKDSIRMRLMSEVPLGVFLSGGVDSSAVVALMSEMVSEPVKTFSVGYEGDAAENEFEYARMVAARYRTNHHEFRLTADDFLGFLPTLVWHLDEPLADASTIPLFYIARLAREHVTVVLSGEGADELLGGYYIYKKMLFLDSLRSLPGAASLAAAAGIVATALGRRKIAHYAAMMQQPLEERYAGVATALTDTERSALFGGATPIPRTTVTGPYYERVRGRPALDRMLYVDTKVWLPDDLLMKADKMTMATSVELRVPFLDHELVEFAASLPVSCKIRRNETKFLLKRAMEKYLPHEVLYRSKKGFPVPISRWFREKTDGIREVLLDDGSASRRFFAHGILEGLIRQHERGQNDMSDVLWPFLVFEYWQAAYMKKGRSGT
ncbi:MAG: asparagine synthase (glutamine-hydrolyzing) [Desulfobulbaceae bacterium A2]|nr:MAG: asparagine synthase (glutamine-hydrolyzing) [Desulfobulbaceae bacterium A2]